MSASPNNPKYLYYLPVFDSRTGNNHPAPALAPNLISAAALFMLYNQEPSVSLMREAIGLTPDETLVLEQIDKLLEARERLSGLVIKTLGAQPWHTSPDVRLRRSLETLVKLETPRWLMIPMPVDCPGCGQTMQPNTRILKVRYGICCNYKCWGLMLAKTGG